MPLVELGSGRCCGGRKLRPLSRRLARSPVVGAALPKSTQAEANKEKSGMDLSVPA